MAVEKPGRGIDVWSIMNSLVAGAILLLIGGAWATVRSGDSTTAITWLIFGFMALTVALFLALVIAAPWWWSTARFGTDRRSLHSQRAAGVLLLVVDVGVIVSWILWIVRES